MVKSLTPLCLAALAALTMTAPTAAAQSSGANTGGNEKTVGLINTANTSIGEPTLTGLGLGSVGKITSPLSASMPWATDDNSDQKVSGSVDTRFCGEPTFTRCIPLPPELVSSAAGSLAGGSLDADAVAGVALSTASSVAVVGTSLPAIGYDGVGRLRIDHRYLTVPGVSSLLRTVGL